MRIQHNIMAMSAYRNYTNNVSAMKSNLEKLSSGYKINRAGDDAAGLAISEKMRAQITGLETAQKNAKDGISLVQTAEGALTEVHDMLNRMVELATQSANGTYDDDTDRAQLQKEMDQLREEINRIADSSNFNGIQLLDGSMDAGGETITTAGSFEFAANHGGSVSTGAISLPTVGTSLGTSSVLHKNAAAGSDTNAFSVDLHNTTLAAGATLTIALGSGDEITIDNTGGTSAMSASDIIKAISDGDTTVAINSTALTAASDLTGNSNLTNLGGTWDITASGTRITFTQSATDDTDVTVPDTVTVSAAAAGGTGTGTGTNAVADVFKVDSITQTGTTGGENITVTVAYNDANGDAQTEDVTFASGSDADGSMAALVTAINNNTTLNALFTAAAVTTGDASDGITLTSQTPGANLKVTGITQKTPGANDSISFGTSSHPTPGADAGSGSTGGDAMTGDYNVTTTVISTKADAQNERLASTYFSLTDAMTTDGSQITIGKDTYTFTTDTSKATTAGYVVYNEGDTAAKKAELLTKAAENNATYTVGTDGTGKITITEVPGQTNFDLTTMSGIEESLGFKSVSTTPVTGKGLTLQIGDTAASYNQLNVSIKDCHTDSLGIKDISIADQTSAQSAIDAIKKAINYVSDVRGTLGATQNRLDHTINNLSVMTENIQDAESTIRDVDVAEEMMSYTKNNILIQASQAMLAQANQVPQGVLQLLQ